MKNMPETIKLMPDYGCYPLWWKVPGKVGNIDPATLPLSQETIKRLDAWANVYDATLNMADPANSVGFSSRETKEDFEQEGVSLWLQLREELAPDYEVVYFDKHRSKLLTHKSELAPKDLVVAESYSAFSQQMKSASSEL
jgi:hypothetical protein